MFMRKRQRIKNKNTRKVQISGQRFLPASRSSWSGVGGAVLVAGVHLLSSGLVGVPATDQTVVLHTVVLMADQPVRAHSTFALQERREKELASENTRLKLTQLVHDSIRWRLTSQTLTCGRKDHFWDLVKIITNWENCKLQFSDMPQNLKT